MRVPRVSVLMTLYNKGSFVEEAARSVLKSTYEDLELIVVDDASTDDGPQHIQRMEDPRIRLLMIERNSGRPAAANKGYDAATGEFIAVLDADDRMHEDRIARQVAYLDAHPDVGAVGTGLSVFGSKKELWNWPEQDEEGRGKMLFGDPVCYGTAMFRRAIIEQHHLRCDETWRTPGMDFLFLLTIAPHLKFANILEPLTYYRVGDQNMRHGRDPLEDRALVYRREFEMFGILASDQDLRSQLMLHRLFRHIPDKHDIVALADWIERLSAMNREKRLFPVRIFEAELHRRFRGLFYLVADHDLSAAYAHLRCTGILNFTNWRYLALVTLRRLSGWRPEDLTTPEPIRS
ncbi:MAG: glycosyltransferase family 2 protein [Flavobacteriales bacterium]|nr:glycosyltransferase family 2 protein [Flavobacteriales bacterium]